MKPWAAFTLLLVSAPVFGQEAEDYSALVQEAVDAIESRFEKQWAFKQTRIEEGRVWVGQYDPRKARGERWSLLSVDGREPTELEVEQYRDDQREPSSSGENLEATVNPDTVTYIGETDEHWLFAFVPEDDDEAFFEHIQSSLKIDKNGRYLSELELRSDKPFKPAFGVKMKEFFTRLTFAPATADGPVVLQSVDAKVRGRAFLVVNFDETTTIANTDFEYAGD